LKRLFVAMLLLSALQGSARADGSAIYSSHCVVCHQANGRGVAAVYPPLADSIGEYVRVAQGREYLVHVVSFGMMGAISAQGKTYHGFMQAWPQLSDEDVAQVLNHVLTTFNAKLLPKGFEPLTAGEVKRYRAARHSISDVRKERDALIKTLQGADGAAHNTPGA